LSTSFQPAEWDLPYFQQVSGSTAALWLLIPRHIRIQPVSQGVPMRAPDQWDFTELDAVLIPKFWRPRARSINAPMLFQQPSR
jgi:hypothetical protein